MAVQNQTPGKELFGNGERFVVNATLVLDTVTNGKRETRCLPLVNDNIVTLEIFNRIDRLYSEGFVIYRDTMGTTADAIGAFNGKCLVAIYRNDVQSNGSVNIQNAPSDAVFSHEFVTDGIEIVTRDENSVVYNIKLVGREYFNLITHFHFNNYGDNSQPKSLTDIAKNLIVGVGLATDGSFDDSGSGVDISYITSENENVLDSIRYLMQKQFFFNDKKDYDIKILYYDMFDDTYRMFQPNKDITPSGIPMMMTFGKENVQKLANRQFVQLASPLSENKRHMVPSMSAIRHWVYSMEGNKMSSSDVPSSQVLNYLQGKIGNTARVQNSSMPTSNNLRRDVSEWNNDEDVYGDMLGIFKDYDSIIVNSAVAFRRPLMSQVSMIVDTDGYITTGDTTDYAKKVSRRFSQLKGGWFVTQIHYIINPKIGKFSQNMQLSRINMNAND